MGLELEHECPHCDSTTFWKTGSTLVGLGRKVKWECTGDDCEYGFVRIDGDVDSAGAESSA